MLTVLRIEK